MTKALDELVDLLDLEPIEVNLFRGVSPNDDFLWRSGHAGRQRVFGGQVAGQALVAAGRTVPAGKGTVHSLHAYFLRPGDPSAPIVYEVDRIRDGRSFTTRRVVAIQHGQAIFNLAASFHIDEPGLEHQHPIPAVPPPDQLARSDHVHRSIDLRSVDGDEPGHARAWFRADGRLPNDPLLHACVVAYASDLSLLDTTLAAHGRHVWSAPELMLASLDHAMWFHRGFRADEWLLYDQDSPVTAGARGFARGSIFTRDGVLVASVVQEGLLRPIAKPT